jgi:hypothetical protein
VIYSNLGSFTGETTKATLRVSKAKVGWSGLGAETDFVDLSTAGDDGADDARYNMTFIEKYSYGIKVALNTRVYTHSIDSISFDLIPFDSILFDSIRSHSIPFHSTPFHSINAHDTFHQGDRELRRQHRRARLLRADERAG